VKGITLLILTLLQNYIYIVHATREVRSCDGSVGVLPMGDLVFESRQIKKFVLFSKSSRSLLVPNQRLIQSVREFVTVLMWHRA